MQNSKSVESGLSNSRWPVTMVKPSFGVPSEPCWPSGMVGGGVGELILKSLFSIRMNVFYVHIKIFIQFYASWQLQIPTKDSQAIRIPTAPGR